ncbi:FMN-binding negative transcriptional regulator [Aeromicrobium sp. SMF47]|uniref:FMN-binding negative transcriptional regulator n=1 Tax=Aeromicrobium yanjiei TaxID=2662028 RepID=A0A5Q2MHX3_9ACTN|nr:MULTISPECIES: FMN-binding negative transcriptional regulator [Aeromicrobium]MRJ76587.1 FMN-binding negative transcriptional regulator [Aeromicrobium yanjiei]MRK00930.1 FMN-binding negative transcriptional regulator [Aeromicrobium sp. S22]QGG42258.1 FMN-binding negative transcriptional regulator [Aeromicrobium yanjiei]
MRHNPAYATDDEQVVRRIIAENPWGMIVSHHDGDLVASHYPMLLDEDADGLTIVTHVGRPDEQLHGLGESEVLLVFQGPHGYISPSWYAPAAGRIPTWDFSTVHCHGTPQVLGEEENLAVLTQLTAHFEQHVEHPAWLDQELGARAAKGTVGLRIPVDRFTAKVKMSQDKDPATVQSVIDHLRAPGPYHQPYLADEIERARTEHVGSASADHEG